EPPKHEANQLLAKFRFVSDFMFRIHAKTHDQAHYLWRGAPTKPITLTANRQVVVQRSAPSKRVRDHMIRLPAFTCAITADVAGSCCLPENLGALHGRGRESPLLFLCALHSTLR